MRDLLLQNRVGRQADRGSVNRGTEMGALPYKSGLGFRNRAGLGGGSHAVKLGYLFNGSSANQVAVPRKLAANVTYPQLFG